MMDLFIDTVIKSSVVLLVTMGTARLLRNQSAALRHLVWTVGLVSALAGPLLGLVLPTWQPEIVANAERPMRSIAPPANIPAPTLRQSSTSTLTPTAISHAPHGMVVAEMLVAIWLIGVLTAALLLLVEIVKLARIVFHADPVHEKTWRDLVLEVSSALQLKRAVRLICNPHASVLGTWGTMHPRIMLPRESETWTGERMRVVLGHELAHVKRNDWLVQIVAESARAIYWFNPLFWIACAQLRRESEYACDDSALRLGIDGPTYATHVLDLARTLKHSDGPGSAALAMANTSNLERRLIAMLNPTLNRTVTTKSTVAIAILLALAVTLPLAAMQSSTARSIAPEIHNDAVLEQTSKNPEPAVKTIGRNKTNAAGQNPDNRIFYMATLYASEPTQPTATQNPGGTLTGSVQDTTGALIPGAAVRLTNSMTGEIRNILTNESGKFEVTNLPAGTYSTTTTLPKFQTGIISAIPVSPGQTTAVNVTLKVGIHSTLLDVFAARPSTNLICFSVFGNVKADGTPFTQADCPNGTSIYLIGYPAQKTAAVPQLEESTPYVAPTNTNNPVQLQANGRPYPIRVGGDVQPGVLSYKASPTYPATALARGVEGSVVVAATIGPDGTVKSVKVIRSSDPVFEGPTMDSVLQWRYTPTLLNRQAVEVMTTITVSFIIDR